MTGRTDLAIEFEKRVNKTRSAEENFGQIKVFLTELEEKNPYNKRKGKYATVNIGKVEFLPDFKEVEKALLFCLLDLVPKESENFLVVGLGNREITSDSVGPLVAQKILATRHLRGTFLHIPELSRLKSVSVITPSVLGKTGIEASEIVLAVVKQTKPDAVIVIDALCANQTENLFSVIQLCDSGISPGSGVKNSRKELSRHTLGVPTVAIGVPTVVEASVIAEEMTGNKAKGETELFLTPKDTDLLCSRVSDAIAQALNVFLQPDTDRETLLSLV